MHSQPFISDSDWGYSRLAYLPQISWETDLIIPVYEKELPLTISWQYNGLSYLKYPESIRAEIMIFLLVLKRLDIAVPKDIKHEIIMRIADYLPITPQTQSKSYFQQVYDIFLRIIS